MGTQVVWEENQPLGVGLALILSTPRAEVVQSNSSVCLILSPTHIPSLHRTRFQFSHQKAFQHVRLTSPGRASGSRTLDLDTCPQKCAAAPAVKMELLLPVLEEATKPKGNKLENRLQDKDDGKDVIANLQGFIKNLGCGHRSGVRRQLSWGAFCLQTPPALLSPATHFPAPDKRLQPWALSDGKCPREESQCFRECTDCISAWPQPSWFTGCFKKQDPVWNHCIFQSGSIL